MRTKILFAAFVATLSLTQLGLAQQGKQRIGIANPYTGESSVRYYNTPKTLKPRSVQLMEMAAIAERNAISAQALRLFGQQGFALARASYDARLARYKAANVSGGNKDLLQKEYEALKREKASLDSSGEMDKSLREEEFAYLQAAATYRREAARERALEAFMPQPRSNTPSGDRTEIGNAAPLTGTIWIVDGSSRTLDFYQQSRFAWRDSPSESGKSYRTTAERGGTWVQTKDAVTLTDDNGNVKRFTVNRNRMTDDYLELRQIKVSGGGHRYVD